MEIKDVFVSVGVMIVGLIAVLSWINGLNGFYGTTVGSSFNSTLDSVNTLARNNFADIGETIGENTQIQSGAGEEDQTNSLIQKSRSTFQKVTTMLGLVPSMLNDAGELIGIPDSIMDVGRILFLGVFGITMAYLFLLGVKSLTGR